MSQTFTIPKFTDVLLRSFNVRAEMHGKDPVPAVDIGFTLTASNDVLDLIDPGLKAALYRAEQEGDEANPELEGVEPISDLRVIRASSLKMPLKLNREYVGRNLVLDYGTGGKSNIELFGDCNEFTVDAKEGGTVEIHFRFQASGLKDKAIGSLGSLIKHTVKITCLSSAEAEGTKQIAPDAGSPFKHSVVGGKTVDNHPTGPADPGPDATDIFVAGGAAPAAPAAAPAKKTPAKKTPAKKVTAAKKAPAKKAR